MSEDRSKTVAEPLAEAETGKAVTHPPRPVKGPVDRKALRESIFKRFDKVLARLAEKE
jgi:hypothetical protein